MFISFHLNPALLPYESRRRAWIPAREEARLAYRAWVESDKPDRAAAFSRLPRRRGARGGRRERVRRVLSRGWAAARSPVTLGGSPCPLASSCCGALTVEVDGRRVEEDLPGRQGRLLFAYLALNRERPVRRDELVDVVWDDRPPGAPDAGLAALLTRVRRALGPEAIEGRGGLRLALPDVSLDIEEARAAAAAAEAALGAGDPDARPSRRARRSSGSSARCCPS